MRILFVVFLLLFATDAAAYIGPGAGIGFLGSLWAVIVGVVLALIAIVIWPMRILWRHLRGKNKAGKPAAPRARDA